MNPVKILYLEDESSLGSVTNDVLQKNGFQVEWVQHGKKALAVFQSRKFDICIVDVMMPGMDGYSFVKEVRKTDPELPIIYLSARTLTEDIVKGFETGGDDYLKKPFTIEELIVRIYALLRRNAFPKTPVTSFTIGKYQYNYAWMELRLEEKIIVLSSKTNELLYRLVTNTDNYMDRKQTLIDLWDDDSRYNARSMDVFITKIRKYFEEDPDISIVNVRGYGYKLIVKR